MQTTKKQLLVCIPDFPFPVRKNGISIRYFPILEHAAKRFDIHLITIVDGNVSEALIEEAEKICAKVSVYVRKPKQVSLPIKVIRRIQSIIPGNTPFPYVQYDEDDIRAFIQEQTRNQHYDVTLSVLVNYQRMLKSIVKASRYTMDVIDSPYSTHLRTQQASLLSRYDGWMIKQWERKALASVDYACYISPLDRTIGAGLSIDEYRIGVIPNGLFIDDHSADKINFNCKTIGYLGHMGYPPNIRAALRLYKIFTANKDKLSDTKLVIIGRDPAKEITQLGLNSNVIITGTVDNIWPYINGVDTFVFPMEIGSGQQNKLLEAMGAGRPVISSTLGNSGIGAAHNQELIEANTDEDIVDAIIKLSSDTRLTTRLSASAKSFIHSRYSWAAIYQQLDSTLLKTR